MFLNVKCCILVVIILLSFRSAFRILIKLLKIIPIMLDAFSYLLYCKLCQHNWPGPTYGNAQVFCLYASIILNAFRHLLCSLLCQHNQRVPIFKRFSIPEQLHPDQGLQFESKFLTEICLLLKCKSTPYHPQSDGLVKRFNLYLISWQPVPRITLLTGKATLEKV